MTRKTTDLGQGWFATLEKATFGETLDIRNPDIGLRVHLRQPQIDKLREIFAAEASLSEGAAS